MTYAELKARVDELERTETLLREELASTRDSADRWHAKYVEHMRASRSAHQRLESTELALMVERRANARLRSGRLERIASKAMAGLMGTDMGRGRGTEDTKTANRRRRVELAMQHAKALASALDAESEKE